MVLRPYGSPARKDGEVHGFGWFGRTFFETDGNGTCRLTAEGLRLAQMRQVEVPERMRDAAFIARCAFLNGRQSALLRAASEGHALAADGSEDADALYLQRCRLARFDPYHDVLYASAGGEERLMLSDGDDARWMTEQGWIIWRSICGIRWRMMGSDCRFGAPSHYGVILEASTKAKGEP